MTLYVCLTHREWANVCSDGRIRIHKVRLVTDPEAAVNERRHDLFALAPDRFSVGDSADLMIAAVAQLCDAQLATAPEASVLGMNWLLLEDITEFFPIRAEDSSAFEADAEQARIRLSAPRFEHLWESWTEAERERSAFVNGMTLVRVFELHSGEDAAPSGAALRTLVPLMLDPRRDAAGLQGMTARLMLDWRVLFDSVRDDTDSSAIFVSCPVAWANLYSGTNLLQAHPELSDRKNALHHRYRDQPFSAKCVSEDDLAYFLGDLIALAPGVFQEGWTPTNITMYVRLRHRLKYGKPSPDEVVSAIKAVEQVDGQPSATLLAFLLGAALESSRTHALARQLQPERFPCERAI
jgi:hypothetical protein